MTDTESEERQLRAMVALVDAQSDQLQVLREAVDTLEAQVAVRSDFDMMVSQELRTPLSVLTDSLDELQAMQPGDSDFEDVLGRCVRNTSYLNETVDELLRPMSGQGPVVDRENLEIVDLDSALLRTTESFGDAERSRLSVSGADGLSIRTSAPRLNGILINIIEQALRNSAGEIDIHASHSTDGVVRVQVVEYTPGQIEKPDDAARPFGEGDRPSKQLGLYLVRMLAQSLGGDLEIASNDKGGLITTVSLPQRRTGDGDPQPKG